MNIPYKKKPSEFEIQAYVYSKLKALGYNIRGSVPNGRKRDRGNEPKMIFDLVIFDTKNCPLLIIEIKDSPRHKKNTAQHKKYKKTGIKVVYIRGMKEAKKYIKKRSICKNLSQQNRQNS